MLLKLPEYYGNLYHSTYTSLLRAFVLDFFMPPNSELSSLLPNSLDTSLSQLILWDFLAGAPFKLTSWMVFGEPF